MKIQTILSQTRRDFRATLVCEHCGETETLNNGYDDTRYHQQVIPNMKCKVCGKKAPEDHRPLAPKYPDGFQI